MFVRCGNLTARDQADGVVPPDMPYSVDYTPGTYSLDPRKAIAELVEKGLRRPPPDEGWQMDYGPSNDWDGQLPVWRYSPPQEGIEVTPGRVVFPDPGE